MLDKQVVVPHDKRHLYILLANIPLYLGLVHQIYVSVLDNKMTGSGADVIN